MDSRLRLTRHPTARLFALLLFALAVAGCETTSVGGVIPVSGEARAEREADSGDAAAAAATYIGLAANATGTERDRLTLLATEQWLIAGDTTRATSAYASIQQPPATANAALEQSVRARILLMRGEPEQALALLEPLSSTAMTTRRRLAVMSQRAETYAVTGEPARSVEIMRQRESYLSDDEDVQRNRELLWNALAASSPDALRSSASEVLDPEVRGWLTLAALSTATGQQGIGWNNGSIRWRERYPDHPAIVILDELPEASATLLEYPRQIALLLPLSGNAARAGQAVQNGFLGAYFASAGGLDDRQSVRVYDVNGEGGASAAYDAAVADGAEFVVGPLLRNDVIELANNSLVPVPVLTLNYLSEGTIAPPGLFQFALAPEDEAIAAADRAIADGHTRAVALVPNSSWGRRLLAAFRDEFEARGGTLLDASSYTAGNPDFSGAIEDLMELSGSVQRYQRLRANIGGPLQFDPRRRQDVEFVFLAADAATGRLMKSQLKFHYAGDLPVYATSLIYAMDGRSDSDLDGVRFADAPWIIAPPVWISHLPPTFANYFPEEKRLARLHAMGYDAYRLTGSLFAYRNAYDMSYDGATGELFLDPDGRVHRRLAWAEFQGGVPVALPDPEPELETDDMDSTDPGEWNRDVETPGVGLEL